MMYFLSGHNLAVDFSTSSVSNQLLPGHVRVRLKDLLELESRFTRDLREPLPELWEEQLESGPSNHDKDY